MDRQLKGIIHYICFKYPSDLSRTVLVKLIYLADVEFTKTFSRKMTRVIYRYDNFGPFSWAIIDTAQELIDKDIITMRRDMNMYGDEKYKYEALVEPRLFNLDGHTLKVLGDTIDKFSGYTFNGLMDYVYTTEPLTSFERGELIDFGVLTAKGGDVMTVPDKIKASNTLAYLTKRSKKHKMEAQADLETGFDAEDLSEFSRNARAQIKVFKTGKKNRE